MKSERIFYEGGKGDSIDQAVITKGAPNNVMGVLAEYRYLTSKFGEQDSIGK